MDNLLEVPEKNDAAFEKFNPEWLRSFPEFEGLHDERCREIIDTLKTYCRIIVRVNGKEIWRMIRK